MELNRYNGLNWPMTKVVTCRFVLTDNYIPANSTSLYLSLNELQIQLKLQYSLSRAYPTKPPGQAFSHSVRYICHPDGYVCHADRHTEVSRPLGQSTKVYLDQTAQTGFSHLVRHRWCLDSYACHTDRYIEVDQWASGLECLTSNQEVPS